MCTCEPNNATEEYYTALSDIETETPDEWRTSTLFDEEEFAPPAFSTPRRTPRRDIPRPSPRAPLRIRRQQDLTAGVAIVRRRIDFDALPDIETAEDLEEEAPREILDRLRRVPPRTVYAPERLRPSRQFPEAPRYAQYAPRMTRTTPCGKCIRI